MIAIGAGLALTLTSCSGDDDTATTTAAPTTEASTSGTEPGAAAPAAGNTITIADFSFSGVTEVPVGTTVVVTNTDPSSHTWTAGDGTFDSGSLSQGDTFEFTFDTVGEFAFACNFHPSMTGTITVTG